MSEEKIVPDNLGNAQDLLAKLKLEIDPENPRHDTTEEAEDQPSHEMIHVRATISGSPIRIIT